MKPTSQAASERFLAGLAGRLGETVEELMDWPVEMATKLCHSETKISRPRAEEVRA